MDSLKHVSVAILSCNRRRDLRLTLDQLFARGPVWKEVVVADNASSDGTVEMLHEAYPNVRVLAQKENCGVAALNSALLSCSGEWVLSLDDDSCPDLDTWGGLAALLGREVEYDTITCTVRNSREMFNVRKEAGRIESYYGLHQAGSLVRKELLQSLSGYDESLFLWGVELDFSARALLQGARLGKCDSAVVEHRCTPANRSSERHAFFYTRNLLTFLKRYAPLRRRQALLSSYLANVLLFTVLHRTLVYWRGARASGRWKVDDRSALSEEQFRGLAPDFRLPFSFLG